MWRQSICSYIYVACALEKLNKRLDGVNHHHLTSKKKKESPGPKIPTVGQYEIIIQMKLQHLIHNTNKTNHLCLTKQSQEKYTRKYRRESWDLTGVILQIPPTPTKKGHIIIKPYSMTSILSLGKPPRI